MSVGHPNPSAGLSPPSPRGRPRHHPLFGGLIVKEGLISQAQLDEALALQRETESPPLLGQILLDQKLVTQHELSAIVAKYHRSQLLGDVLVGTHVVTRAELEMALASQRKTHAAPLGHTLIRLGFITERQLKKALGLQLGIPLVDLDEGAIDASVAALISERYARHHRALPIAEREGRILLAMDDPTDVDVVAEVRSCLGRQIDVAVTGADDLEQAFSRVYGSQRDAPAGHPTVTGTAAGGAREAPAEMRETALRAEPRTNGRGGQTPAPRTDAVRTRPGPPLAAVRAQLDVIRRAARNWERWTSTVETLLRERLERATTIDRLTGELREARTDLARASQELEANVEALATLEAAHAMVLRERESLERSLADLRDRHAALLRDRAFAIDRIRAALRRLGR